MEIYDDEVDYSSEPSNLFPWYEPAGSPPLLSNRDSVWDDVEDQWVVAPFFPSPPYTSSFAAPGTSLAMFLHSLILVVSSSRARFFASRVSSPFTLFG
jgi:hypothetical protein